MESPYYRSLSTLCDLYGGAVHYHQSSGTIANEVTRAGCRSTASGSKYNFTVTANTVFAGGIAYENESVSVTKSAESPVGML